MALNFQQIYDSVFKMSPLQETMSDGQLAEVLTIALKEINPTIQQKVRSISKYEMALNFQQIYDSVFKMSPLQETMSDGQLAEVLTIALKEINPTIQQKVRSISKYELDAYWEEQNNSPCSHEGHTHYFQPDAVFALIEIIKYHPIIFVGDISIPLAKEMIDLEWVVIVAMINRGKWDLKRRIHWTHCLRRVWGWMQSVFFRYYQGKQALQPEHYFIPYLKFLGPHMNWENFQPTEDSSTIKSYPHFSHLENYSKGAFDIRVPPQSAVTRGLPCIVLEFQKQPTIDTRSKETTGSLP